MDKNIILSGFTEYELVCNLRERNYVFLRGDLDEDIISEVYRRNIEDVFIDSYIEENGVGVYDASDEQIGEEFESRELHVEMLEKNLSKIYELIRTGNDFSRELAELIYEHTGRSL